jgi:hypothetical protein
MAEDRFSLSEGPFLLAEDGLLSAEDSFFSAEDGLLSAEDRFSLAEVLFQLAEGLFLLAKRLCSWTGCIFSLGTEGFGDEPGRSDACRVALIYLIANGPNFSDGTQRIPRTADESTSESRPRRNPHPTAGRNRAAPTARQSGLFSLS